MAWRVWWFGGVSPTLKLVQATVEAIALLSLATRYARQHLHVLCTNDRQENVDGGVRILRKLSVATDDGNLHVEAPSFKNVLVKISKTADPSG